MAINVKRKSNLSIPTENFIVLHHLPSSNPAHKLIIPVDPDAISDSMGASFAENTPLSRSAPIYSYQHSGPRSVQVSFTLHRDLCREYNPGVPDMVDALVTNLDALVLPDYDSASKIVNPPVVSLKIRDEIYIKGVVTGSVGVTYSLPLINYGTADKALYKYAVVSISFGVSEITPYSASILPDAGGKYRATSGLISTPSSSSATSANTSYTAVSSSSGGGGGSTLRGMYV